MEIVLNEFSIENESSNVEDFFDKLIVFMKVQRAIDKCALPLLTSTEFYNAKITEEYTLHDVLMRKEFRGRTEITKFKQLLHNLISKPPFWDEDQIHKDSDVYRCEHTRKTHGYSLAEACERDKFVASFVHNSFLEPIILVYKNGTKINLTNVKNHSELIEILHESKIISELDYCKVLFEGTKLSFEKLEVGYGFEEMEVYEKKAFISTFKNFSQMDWQEIHKSDGFDYKKYSPSESNNWFRNSKFVSKQIDKFRSSQKYRCFGYREKDVFFVLRLETNHKNSDHG